MHSVKDAFFDRKQTAVGGEKCPGCGDNMEFDPAAGCLKCPSCGSTKEIAAEAGQELAFSDLRGSTGSWAGETHVYHCNNCNAEEALDKREIAHICPFCGSPSVVEREEIDTLRPNALLPFLIGKDKAAELAEAWAKKRLFAPNDFKTYFRPENLGGVYLPAFTFDTEAYSTYEGRLGEYYYVTDRKNGKEVRRQRTRYFSVSGEYNSSFDDIAVNATDAVPAKVMQTLMRYDYHNSVVYNEDFLYGFSALLYKKEGTACWEDAKAQADREIRRSILSQYTYDTEEYLNVSTAYFNVTYKYLLLPMYIGNYRYSDKIYSFYINGRSGKLKGKAPVSGKKVAVFAGILAAVGILLGLVCWLIAR